MEKMSFWIFNESKNIDQYIYILNNDRLDYVKKGDKDKIVSLTNNKEIEKKAVNLLNKEIEYCFFKLRTNDCEKEIFTDILIYTINESKVKMNVFRGKTNTRKAIGVYFNKSIWGELGEFKENRLGINEDLLFWMFKMYIDTRDVSLSDNDEIYINALRGYSGVTKDNNNKIRGEGERISEILGTLAFLLNDEPLKMLRSKIHFKDRTQNHDILLELKMSGTIKMDSKSYKGSLLKVYNDTELVSILSILCSEIIVPKLIQSHRDALASDRWGISLKKEFLQKIGEEIQNRVDLELKRISDEPDKYQQELKV